MRSLGALQAELAATGLADLVVLLDIKLDTPIYRHNRPVNDNSWGGTFDSKTYSPDSFAISEIEHGLLGRRPSFTLTLQNVTHPTTGAALPWSTVLNVDETELNGTEVQVRVAKLSVLVGGDEDAVLSEQRWYVSGGGLEGTSLKLRCSPPADALAWEIPIFSIISQTCGWLYKQGACQATGSQTSCPKNFPACIARHEVGAPLSYGPGFPFFVKETRRRTG